MVTRLKDVDAVMVGMGWTGPIVARELTKAGLNVVGLERGPDRDPADEFVIPRLRDELRYALRLELMQNNALDTVTFRNATDDRALPIRRFGAFLPGEGVGGTGIHWGAMHWRFLPSDFRIRSELSQRYGSKAIPADMTITDWPVSYAEGMTLGACEYCGFCNRTGCEANAKASANITVMPALRADPRFELRTRAFVSRLIYDKAAKRVTGVAYTDMRTGEEFEQPAGLVVLPSSVFGNTQQLLLAGIGEPDDPVPRKGLAGKNYGSR